MSRSWSPLAGLVLAGCTSAGPRLVVNLVLPETPSPADDSLTSLQIAVAWNGGDAGLTTELQDGGVNLPLPAGPVDVTVTGLDGSGTALWKGVARGVEVPSNADAGPAVATLLFGRIGSFSSFASIAAMPPLAGSAAVSWADGRVVISGGQLADGGLSDGVWVYDPRTVRVSPMGSLLFPRAHHLALPLLSLTGQPMVLLAGGDAPGGGVTDTVELFSQDGGLLLSPLSSPQREPSGAVAGDGLSVLLGCGTPGSRSLDLYVPAAADAGGAVGALPLASSAACELGQISWVPALGAFIAGDGSDGTLSVEDIAGEGVAFWAQSQDLRTRFGAVPSGSAVLQFGGLVAGAAVPSYESDVDAGLAATGTLLGTARADFGWLQIPDGGVLVVGGADVEGAPLSSAELFSPQGPGPASPAGQMARARIHPAIADISGYGAALVVSGELDGGEPVPGLEIYTY